MQRAGSPPRWEFPGPIETGGDAIFLGSTRVASVAGTRVAVTEVATGARRLLWPRADSAIVRLAASGDGRFLAAEASDEVLVWDGPDFAGRVPVKEPPDRFDNHRWMPSLQFAPNGRTLVLAHREGVTLWDTIRHETVAVVACSEFLFAGDRVVVNGTVVEPATGNVLAKLRDRGIFVWELATGAVLRKLDVPNSRVRALALGGDWIVATVGKELVAWQGRAPAVPTWRWPLSGRPVFSVATDGHVVAVAHGAGGVSLYSLADGRERSTTVRLWNASAPEAVLEAPDGAIWDAAGGLLSMSRCVRGDQEVPTELCESLWVQDDLWRRRPGSPRPDDPWESEAHCDSLNPVNLLSQGLNQRSHRVGVS